MAVFVVNMAVTILSGVVLGLMLAWGLGRWSRLLLLAAWFVFGAPFLTLLFFLAFLLAGRLAPWVWSSLSPGSYHRLLGERLWRRYAVRFPREGWGNLALQLGLCQSTPGVLVQQAPAFTVIGFGEDGDLHALVGPLPG